LIFLLPLEEHSVALDLPLNLILHTVLLNEHLELILVADHEQAGHVLDGDGLIGSLSGSSDLKADGVDEFVDEKLVSGMGHVVLGG
jgi:hypothetical protein